jgi:hypothetical protein
MTSYRWILQDDARTDLRSTETFSSKEEAEAWMGAEWARLADEGATYVVLMEDGSVLYRMGLGEA